MVEVEGLVGVGRVDFVRMSLKGLILRIWRVLHTLKRISVKFLRIYDWCDAKRTQSLYIHLVQ